MTFSDRAAVIFVEDQAFAGAAGFLTDYISKVLGSAVIL